MSGNPGFMVMVNELFGDGGETSKALKQSLGKEISEIKIEYDILTFALLDKDHPQGFFKLEIWDNGQSCCENRYMHTDDDLPYYVGATLEDMKVVDGPEEEEEWGRVKESQFMKVKTSKGVFTVVNYNEHNGYYGGFRVSAKIC